MNNPKVSDAEFQVIEAPAGMTWRQYARSMKQERRLQRRDERAATKRLHAWSAGQQLRYVAYMTALLLGGMALLKLGAIIWFSLQPPAPPAGAVAPLELHSPSERH